ncbi:MAG: MBL fold metallo-hydrolase [Promethearchaeota archaeon]
MSFYGIDNLKLTQLTDDALLCHQIKASSLFTCCDGLIIKPTKGHNNKTVILDLNLEPQYIKQIYQDFGPVSDYVCSHTHLDHSAHVHVWEDLGVKIHVPQQEHEHLLDHKILLERFGFLEGVSLSTGEQFVKYNGFEKCKTVHPFQPGSILDLDGLLVETKHFPGHSFGHVGFYIPSQKLFHISCLGFDQPKPNIDGFGPWYGFKHNSIMQYLKDIDHAESFFLNNAKILTSSHSYVIKNPDKTPFEYMRRKIKENQEKVDNAFKSLGKPQISEDNAVNELLKLDLFFPKHKLKDFLLEIFILWESWFIRNHIKRSKTINF